MTTIDLRTWEKFREELKNLRERQVERQKKPGPMPSGLLFRGQENSCYQLSATLERPPDGREGMPFQDYFESIYGAKSEIESFTGKEWELPESTKLNKLMEKHEPFARFTAEDNKTWGQVWAYMVHLRHHGFPSPFLDWTRSPYIAAFFAFRRAMEGMGKVSIYVYCEMPDPKNHPKGYSSNRPTIYIVPKQYVQTHRRHFLQQCEYTVCMAWKDGGWRFAPNESVFGCKQSSSNAPQDVLWKFNIPSTERPKLLKLLDDDYNINAFSLFGSEESLMETLALRDPALQRH